MQYSLSSPLLAMVVTLSSMSVAAPALAGNHAPSGTSGTVSTSQSTSYTFQVADFGFSDPNDSPADTLSAVKISTLPVLGTLTLNGAAVTSGQFVTAADIASGKLIYAPVAGAYGAPYSSFTFQVQDSGTGNTNAVTLMTNQSALASSLNATKTATASLPTSTYPNLAVAGAVGTGANVWSIWQPSVVTVTSTLFNASVTYPTAYLDEISNPSARNSTWQFLNNGSPATVSDLANATKTYTYVFGVAGLGGSSSDNQTITSNVPLTVIANGDAFGTNLYAYLDGQDTNIGTNPAALGLTGTVISTNPNRTVSQGYTFFSLPNNASSISLTESGHDAHGIVFGVVETTLGTTIDPSPKTLAINVLTTPPVANDDSFSTQVNTAITLTSSQLLANDSDADGHALTVTSVQSPSNGSVTLSGGNVVFTPTTGFVGTASFTYTVSDGHGGSATATVSINVVNTPPVAADDSFSTQVNTAITLTSSQLLANDSDADGHALTVTSVQSPSNGSVTLSGGNVVFTPTTGFVGTASFTYTVSDGHGGSATATVSVNVAAPLAATPVPMGGAGLLALISALLAGLGSMQLQRRKS